MVRGTERERYNKNGGVEVTCSQPGTTYKGPLHVFLKSNYGWEKWISGGPGSHFPCTQPFFRLSRSLTICLPSRELSRTHKTPHFHPTDSQHLIACWGQQFFTSSLLCGVLISASTNRMWLLVFVGDSLLCAQEAAVKELSECSSNTGTETGTSIFTFTKGYTLVI